MTRPRLIDLFGAELLTHPALIFTAHYGHNAAMIASVARLYVPDGATVIDVTWGRGAFWLRTDTTRFTLIGSDLLDAPGALTRADFRALPFAPASADVVVIDPPYVHSTTQPRHIESNYRNNESTPGKTQLDIIELYRDGMTEALRVLRPGGTCWVKCQDAVEGRTQQWNMVTLHGIAAELGYAAQDLFVLVNPSPPETRHAARQFHARRNHSYLWIFRKAERARQRGRPEQRSISNSAG